MSLVDQHDVKLRYRVVLAELQIDPESVCLFFPQREDVPQGVELCAEVARRLGCSVADVTWARHPGHLVRAGMLAERLRFDAQFRDFVERGNNTAEKLVALLPGLRLTDVKRHAKRLGIALWPKPRHTWTQFEGDRRGEHGSRCDRCGIVQYRRATGTTYFRDKRQIITRYTPPCAPEVR